MPSVFRPRDVGRLDLSRSRLRALVRTGEIDHLGRGLYRHRAAEATELETVATVCARVPSAIVCLLSALAIHDIGTQQPPDIWIAFDRKARKPRLHGLPVHIVRFSGPMLRHGITTRRIQGVPMHITSPSRTVIDCFRYRNKLGLDVALEALRDALGRRLVTADELVRAAQTCRIYSVMKPYLQAVLS